MIRIARTSKAVCRLAIAAVIVAFGAAPMSRLAPPARPFDLERRLEALDPARPVTYFELAEEIADGIAPGESDDRTLARRLYGLAGRLDPDGLAASAALGLASLAPDARTATRYRAVASLLDPGVGGSIGTGRPEVDLETAFEVADAFGGFRSGRSIQLRRLLADPAGERLLRAWNDALPGGVEWLRSQAESEGGGRPALSRRDVLALIRIELSLLDLGRPNWSTLLAIEQDPPIIDLRPERVPAMLLDDDAFRRPIRRRGEWRSP